MKTYKLRTRQYGNEPIEVGKHFYNIIGGVVCGHCSSDNHIRCHNRTTIGENCYCYSIGHKFTLNFQLPIP